LIPRRPGAAPCLSRAKRDQLNTFEGLSLASQGQNLLLASPGQNSLDSGGRWEGYASMSAMCAFPSPASPPSFEAHHTRTHAHVHAHAHTRTRTRTHAHVHAHAAGGVGGGTRRCRRFARCRRPHRLLRSRRRREITTDMQ
jgi:hypothetical protein